MAGACTWKESDLPVQPCKVGHWIKKFVLEASADWHWKLPSLPGRYVPVFTSLQTHCPSLCFRPTAEPEFFFFFFLALRSSFIHFFGICLCVLFLFAATGFPVLPRARWCQSFPSPQVLFRILMNCIYVHIHSIYFKFPVKRRCVCRKRRTTAEAACWFSFSCLVVVFYRVAFFSLPALLFPCVQRLIAMRS